MSKGEHVKFMYIQAKVGNFCSACYKAWPIIASLYNIHTFEACMKLIIGCLWKQVVMLL
jgi:hypothetical protein